MPKKSLNVLFASSEAVPFIKTGGLADVSGSLPPVLRGLGQDVRLILPAYPEALQRIGETREVAQLRLPGHHESVHLLEGRGENDMPVYLVDAPSAFRRKGNPYVGPKGIDWPDNHRRFTLFSRAVAALGLNRAGLDWNPDIVHCNDWQTGLVPALMDHEWQRPATLFTIHNLSYFGLFSHEAFEELHLPTDLWRMEGLEFYGSGSFLKAGLAYADQITTVSPTYAGEIRTATFGYGLEGLLQFRSNRLSGILNGIDYAAWNPATDPHLDHPYDLSTLDNRIHNKRELQREFDLPERDNALLFGYIGRLVEQKGADLILDILPRLQRQGNAQVVFLGSGNPDLEQTLREAQYQFPEMVRCRIGYDEGLSHRIEGGCDAFLMPSRFEPCGLNQLYSLRYGCVPIVHTTGGLADSVVDVTAATLKNGSATGFSFLHANPDGLWYAVHRALECYHNRPDLWLELMTRGMQSDFSWERSAGQYLRLYHKALHGEPGP
ncbi:MAG: glycogen synthase GlgA [Gammaproteobacteria bacterium]|nr:glycogen synthase GlgA [Gammaproteobacteria bacterium]MBU1653926.1 glycogen synthase GlgA [Gammaproteobacteria bacterium]MBU1960923.1 glycogen synthase GlgA [Gammaproteobacteria bacterium]